MMYPFSEYITLTKYHFVIGYSTTQTNTTLFGMQSYHQEVFFLVNIQNNELHIYYNFRVFKYLINNNI